MSKRDDREDLNRLRCMAAEDALAISPEDMALEDAEDGVDAGAEAERWRAAMRATVAQMAREAQPKRSSDYAPLSARLRKRPDMEALKSLVRGVFASQPKLGLAYRDGTRQSDEDWQSLYDDLVDTGAIVPDEHED